MIKRYSQICVDDAGYPEAQMLEMPHGAWVKYEDHVQAVEDALDDVAYDMMMQERLRD